jgi:dihydrofolate reductase
MIISVIVAAADNDVIGCDGALPWHLPQDLRRFRELTTGHVVVMGRLTYQSILARLGHPLAGRTSVVVSTSLAGTGYTRARVAAGLPEALSLAERLAGEAGQGEFFIAGGESVYRQSLPRADRIYLTRVHAAVDGDRVMPPGWLDGFALVRSGRAADPGATPGYEFLDYQRVPG